MYPDRRPLAWRLAFIAGLLWLGCAARSAAHEGPPFPLVMDKPAGPYSVSLWADPDIGQAEFYVVVELPEGGPPRDRPSVTLWVEPTNGRLERTAYPGKLQMLRNQMQFVVEPYFDQRDLWRVGVELVSPAGESASLEVEVESTPPGFGPWDLAIYLFPFVMIGGLWAWAMLRRRTAGRDGPAVTGDAAEARR